MTVVLPIEVKKRSLNGKTWLALVLASQGITSIIGSKYEIVENMDRISTEIYLDKGSISGSSYIKHMKKLAESGVKCFILDAEGGAFKGGLSKRRLHPEVLRRLTKYLCWGDKASTVVENNTILSQKKIDIVGNPRFDLLHKDKRCFYKKEAEELKNKYGKYILFNSNFTPINYRYSDKHKLTSSCTKQQLVIMQKLHEKILTLLDYISQEFDTLNVVIRPHPLEDYELYKSLFSDRKNIYIEGGGNCRPWILASEAVLHNGCTTGLEAFLLDVPVIEFAPLRYEKEKISGKLSKTIESKSEVIEYIYGLLEEKKNNIPKTEVHQKKGKKILKEYIWNVDSSSAHKISELFLNSSSGDKKGQKVRPIFRRQVKRGIKRITGENLYNIIISLYSKKKIYLDYRNKKFSGLEYSELEKIINTMVENIPQISNLSYKMSKVVNTKTCYKITPK